MIPLLKWDSGLPLIKMNIYVASTERDMALGQFFVGPNRDRAGNVAKAFFQVISPPQQ